MEQKSKSKKMELHLKYIDNALIGFQKIITCPDCGRILDTKYEQKIHLKQQVCVKSRCKICERDLLHHSCPKWHFLEPFWLKKHLNYSFKKIFNGSPKTKTLTINSSNSNISRRHYIIDHEKYGSTIYQIKDKQYPLII